MELKVENFIKKCYPNIDIKQLKNSKDPMCDVLGFDSLGFVRFIVDLEDFIEKEILSSDIYNMNNTYNDFLEIIKKDNIDK